MKRLFFGIFLFVLIVAAYLLGPRFEKPVYSNELPALPLSVENVEIYVKHKEANFDIKEDNEARIIWANDSLKQKTAYSIVYLPGFTASWYEGNPTHMNFAKAIGANMYLSRLKAHGLKHPDAFAEMDPAGLYESAKEALVVAKTLGEKVLVMGTSTGGTLALKLAADFPDEVEALVLLSPNIRINNSAAFLLSGPWGLTIAQMNGDGSPYRDLGKGMPIEHKYWYRKYRWEAVVYLQQLVESTMNKSTYQKVKCPLFLGYFFKDEEHQDQTVRVDAMLEMFDEISTPEKLKVKEAFPEAGGHVIGCAELSGAAGKVEEAIVRYFNQIASEAKGQ